MATPPTTSHVDFDVRTNLRPIMDELKAVEPRLATNFRRALRQTGDAVIQKQVEILRSEPVGGVVLSRTYAWLPGRSRGGYRRGPRAKELGGARLISVEAQAAARSRHTGLRDEVAANLTTRVSAPASGKGASVRVKSTRPFWGSKALNAKTWRHRVFPQPGRRETWVMQHGNQYFTRGGYAGRPIAQGLIINAINDATLPLSKPTT